MNRLQPPGEPLSTSVHAEPFGQSQDRPVEAKAAFDKLGANGGVLHHRFSGRIFLALLAGLLALPAHAEDIPVTLAPVVVSGSRIEHGSFDLPASVDVIDSRRIGEGQPRVNASEALAGVPGLVVLNRQNYAQDLQISSRGFGARSAFGVRGVRLIADNIPATMPDGQGQAATFDLDTAERIEILRGPYSAIYGNHAGGVIQLFSREGQAPNSISASVLGGSFGSSKMGVGAQGHSGAVGFVIDTSRFDTDGYRDHSAATRDQSFIRLDMRPDADSRISLMGNSLKQSNTQDALGLTAAQMQRNPRGVDPSATTFNTRKSIDHVQGGGTWEQRFGAQRIQVTAYTGSRSVTQYQAIPIATQNASVKNSGGVVTFDRDFSGVEARWTGQFDTGAGYHLTTTAGLDYETSRDDRKGYNNFIGGVGSVCGVTAICGVTGTLRRRESDDVTSVAPYLQAEWMAETWSFTAGLRRSIVRFDVQDRFLANGNDSGKLGYAKATPVLGVLYRLTPEVNLYASSGRGFETPTLNELFYSGAGNGFNFNLQAATSRHCEVGAKAMVGDSTRINAALFRVNTQHELVVDQSSGGRTSYKNAGGTTRQGVEFSLETAWSYGITGRLAWTVMSATYDDSFVTRIGVGGVLLPRTVAVGSHLPGVPDRNLYGELAWKSVDDAWGAAVEATGRSRMFVEDSNSFAPAPGFASVNLRLTAEQRTGSWKLSQFLRVDNVFDARYVGSVIVGDNNNRYYEPAPGRGWMLGVGLRHAFR